jgi:hypothetical protein
LEVFKRFCLNELRIVLVAKLRTNKITDIKEANRYLKEEFLEGYWRKEKIVKAKSEITKYRPLQVSHDLSEVFSSATCAR